MGLIDNGGVVLISLRERSERQPKLIVQCQLSVPHEEIAIESVAELLLPLKLGTVHVLGHIGKVLWQAHHLAALVSTLLHIVGHLHIILFVVLVGRELDQTYDGLEAVLLGRQRVLIISNPVQYR